MSDPTLVVRFGDLEAIVAALLTAHDAVVSQVESVRGDVEDLLAGWAAGTGPRAGVRRAVL
jgi:hypothetical protein